MYVYVCMFVYIYVYIYLHTYTHRQKCTCVYLYLLGGHVISDGGCTCPGDFSKAFGAGADFVMAGGMFASHYESGGDIVEINGKLFKQFYGTPLSPKTIPP